jgi:hypothetical protein
MSVYKLPYPAELAYRLRGSLPKNPSGASIHNVLVTPRDADERKCAAWCADHYEVSAYYMATDLAGWERLEEALAAVPGVYLTTRVIGSGTGQHGGWVSNPAWPPRLGTKRRDLRHLRPQVIALIRDEADP